MKDLKKQSPPTVAVSKEIMLQIINFQLGKMTNSSILEVLGFRSKLEVVR